MPLVIPMVASRTGTPASTAPPAAMMAPTYGNLMQTSSASPAVGSGPLGSDHNLPIHVAALILLALGVVIVLDRAGFRFAATVGAGR